MWTKALLERGANPFLTFIPADRDPLHVEQYKQIYKLLDEAKPAYLANLRAQSIGHKKPRKGSQVDSDASHVCCHVSLCPMQTGPPPSALVLHYRTVVLSDSKVDPDAHALITSPLAEATLKNMCVCFCVVVSFCLMCVHVSFAKYQSAGKQKDSWSMMQTLNLVVDRISLL